ncbi:MAG: N-6 DNA methylase [Candidatus Omnitrophica bacterium]|nr:N-6 DNA methylase [Candidatus Omnitrophota bacterium]
MLTPNMKSLINQLWDKFWSGGISNPLTAIEQISYLLFMRRLDELDTKQKSDAEFTGDKYVSMFSGKFKIPNSDETVDKATLRWSHFKQMEGGEMLRHMQTKIFPFIKQLNGSNTAFARHMEDAVFIIPKASLLVEAVSIIDRLYEDIEKQMQAGQMFHDTQGDMYEFLLGEIAQAGKNGQFRTPRHIIQLMCELVAPKLPESICDPACGTAGFLLGAYQHILTQHTSKEQLFTDENGFTRGTLGDKITDERLWKQLKEKTFFGYDFDSTMVRIGLMNLILHGISNPNIDRRDTLSKNFNEDDKYDVILANPPFKGSIDAGDINEGFSLKTTKTELLFVNRIINSLRIGGRAAVIVPDGVLFGSSGAHRDLREMLIKKCELQGVVSMPSGVFKPYAGVSTAILIFVKGGTTQKVWFYDMQSDGYSLDDKREKIAANDLPDIAKEWKARSKNKNDDRKEKHFFVPVKEIIDNNYDLSINRYKEIAYEPVKYEKPEKILDKIEKIEEEIGAGLKKLRELI